MVHGLHMNLILEDTQNISGSTVKTLSGNMSLVCYSGITCKVVSVKIFLYAPLNTKVWAFLLLLIFISEVKQTVPLFEKKV